MPTKKKTTQSAKKEVKKNSEVQKRTANFKVSVFDLKGKKQGQVTLDENIFGVKINPNALQEFYLNYLANRRAATAHTKDRGEKRGGGRKPWRQKGTGNARHGSIRSPIWRGGGVTFGPRNERNYQAKVNKKAKKIGLKMALSGKLKDEEIRVISDLSKISGKTKAGAALLKGLKISEEKKQGKKYLVTSELKDDKILRSFRNLKTAEVRNVQDLNLADVVRFKYLILDKKALELLKERLSKR
jgi:large subunit ribosomal protein L4